ncbi:MAG: WG repeat-containing protein [Bacteroidota bacterium]
MGIIGFNAPWKKTNEFHTFATMMRDWTKIGLLSLLLLFSYVAEAKDLRRILRAIEKGDYPRTMELIETSLAEQAINPGVKYILADLMTVDSLPIYNIDSARIRIREAMEDYAVATYDQLEELSKNGIGIKDLEWLDARVEDLHHDRAQDEHSVEAFERFMELYPLSVRVRGFVRSRDSLVWLAVEPQYQVGQYRQFLDTYPKSHLFDQVSTAYDSLLFFTETATDKLEDYRRFLDQYPRTPYRERTERTIFERMTASNDIEGIEAFTVAYDNPALDIRAYDIGFHLDESFDYSGHPRMDSLLRVVRQDRRPLAPVLINDKFHFMNSVGAKIRGVSFERIPDEYLCGNISGDVLIGLGATGGVYNRLGTEIFRGNVLEAKDLGLGVLLVRGGGNRLVHKSGFTIWEGFQDAEVVGNRWIKLQQDGKYGLISISGYPVTSFKYDDIWTEGAFWIFEREDLLAVYTIDRIVEELYDSALELEFKFDDIEMYRDTLAIGFRGDRECLLDKNLEFLIPWGEHQVSPGAPYHYSRTEQGYRLHGPVGEPRDLSYYTELQDTDAWMALRSDTSWLLLDKAMADSGFIAVDSAHLVGNRNALIKDAGQELLLSTSGDTLVITEDQRVTTLQPLEAGTPARFLLIADRRRQQVFSVDGELLFEGEYQEIKPLNDSLFVLKERGKLGVIDYNGKQVVSQRYEALQVADGMIFLLRDGKIGGYDLRKEKAFANRYEARLERMGPYYFTALNGRKGLIDDDERVILPFEYQDIKAFNDTIYWVRDNGQWSLFNLETREPILEEVTRFDPLGEQGMVLFYGSDGYGILQRDAEVELDASFNSIQNVGSASDPILFVEEYSQTADFYVITYLNAAGERLGSFGYRPNDFERVICED